MTITISQSITSRLVSRKFWIVIGYAAIATFIDELGIDISPSELENLTYVVLAYIGLQGGADAVREYASRRETPAG